MFIRINTSSGVPIYRQIIDQVKVAVSRGVVAKGEKLPSVRALSEALVINPTTVQRAYMDLERDGVIETRRGQGTFILGNGASLSDDERLRRATEHVRNAVAEGRQLQLSRAALERIFQEEIDHVYGGVAGAAKESNDG